MRVATPDRRRFAVPLSPCSILYINSAASPCTQTQALRSLGFHVTESVDTPPADQMERYHAVIIRAAPEYPLPTIANRLRARPRFDRRVLVALVAQAVSVRDRRDAVDSGFDAVLAEECSARDLAAAILGLLRKYPEHRCVLRTVTGRRQAA
jgi:CheY-like chemotaxis protein